MTNFSTELSGSLIFRSSSITTAVFRPSSLGLQLTGSLKVSGSDIILNGSSIDTRISTLEAGSVGVSLLPLNQFSGSTNTFTGSTLTRLSSLQAATSSYLTSAPSGTVSSSAQIETLGFITSSGVSSYSDLSNIPSGIVSSSTQIEALGFATSSGDVTQLNIFTSSANTSITALNAATSSYLTSIPAGTVSSSAQIENLGFVTSSGDIGELNTFTSSASSRLDSLQAATSSYITSIPSGTVSSSAQITTLGYLTSASAASAGFGSGGGSSFTLTNAKIADLGAGILSGSDQVDFNGNRIVSNESLRGLFSASFNPGTSGSVVDFLNAVFFPNTSPSISTGNQVIEEYQASGSSVVTIAGSDAEGQSLTFSTSSAYTADLFRVSGSGLITLNSLASASFNTDNRGDDVLAHPIIVSATDTFNATTNKTIYISIDDIG